MKTKYKQSVTSKSSTTAQKARECYINSPLVNPVGKQKPVGNPKPGGIPMNQIQYGNLNSGMKIIRN